MRNILSKLWKDDGGALIATEWVFVATILVIGVTVGLVAVRNAVNAEVTEFANSVDSLNTCYSISGQQNSAASTGDSEVKIHKSEPIQTTNSSVEHPVCVSNNP